MTPAPVLPRLLSLDDPQTTDASLTGGKASRLAALRQRGLPVPPGFVLTTRWDPRASLDELADELGDALDALGADAVAVRSSGIAEDLAHASFAGLYETVLDVRGRDAVVRAIAHCLDSAGQARVAAYREQLGLDAAPLAVLVQAMVPAQAAGVAFTAHPVTGERDVVVLSAVPGLGEALVSGQRSAEEWELRERPMRVRGVEQVLDPLEAEAVAMLARRVGDGDPTDIEWALGPGPAGARSVHLLQARPMTALPDVVRWDSPTPHAFVRNFRLGEWIGAPVSPLFESWMLTDIERRPHLDAQEMLGMDLPEPLHVVVNGWYFYGGMNYDMGIGATLRALAHLPGVLLGPRRSQFLATLPPLAHLGFDAELARWRTELLPALVSVVDAAAARVEHVDGSALLDLVQEIVDATAVQASSILGVAGYAAKAEGALFMFWRKHLADHDGTVIDLVVGSEVAPAAHDVEGLDPIFPTLGERGPLPEPPSPETRAAVIRRRDDAEQRALDALPARRHAEFRRLVAEARRGHAARLEQTGWFTLGWPVLRRALARLGQDLVHRGLLPAADDIHFLTRAELMAAVAGGVDRPPVAARRAIWTRQRQLAPPIVIGEMKGFMKATFEPINALLHHEEHDAPDALVGMPGSPGRVTGRARIVFGVDELDRLAPGEILVAPVTTPAWTLAFGRAAAIVTDTGSIASHASIVAREHGIPAVVATGRGTARIVDGQLITVDGGRGVVRLGEALRG